MSSFVNVRGKLVADRRSKFHSLKAERFSRPLMVLPGSQAMDAWRE